MTKVIALLTLMSAGAMLAQEAPARVDGVIAHQWIAMVPLSSGPGLTGRVPPSETLDSAKLKDRSVELLSKAHAAQFGIASEILLNRTDSNIQMAVRTKSGQVEWHRDDADILIGVEGSAQIVTGGEIVHGKETTPGEVRGDSVRGGTTQIFRPGDYVRIEAGVAHQFLLAPGTTIRYMAVKVRVRK